MKNYKILTVLILSLGFVFSQSSTKKIGDTYYNSGSKKKNTSSYIYDNDDKKEKSNSIWD